MTMSERRHLLDKNGEAIGQLRKKKSPGLHDDAYYNGPQGDEKKCRVKHTGTLNPMKSDAKIYLGDEEIGKSSGNWRAKTFAIELNGKEVATVGRKRTLTSTFTDADCYVIDIDPGVDQAFIVPITLDLDELYHEPEQSSIG
jgi:uncharacterized protein YxjI